MRNLKKLFTIFVVTLIFGSLVFGPNVMAESSETTSESDPIYNLVPQDTYTLLEITPTNINSFLYDKYKEGMESIIDTEFQLYANDIKELESIKDLLTKNYKTKKILEGYKNVETILGNYWEDSWAEEIEDEMDEAKPTEEKTTVMSKFTIFEFSEEDFQTLLTLLGENLIEAETESDALIYKPHSWSYKFFMHKGNYLILSDHKETLETIYATTAETDITKNNSYIDAKNLFLEENAISVYVDFEYIKSQLQIFFDEIMGETLLDAIKYFAISVKEQNGNIQVQFATSNDSAVLENLGIDYTDTKTIPYLYKLMPKGNPLFYTESFNLKKLWDTAEKSTEEAEENINELKEEFTSETGLELDTQVLPLFEKGISLLVQDTNDFLPSFTTLIDVNGKAETANKSLDILIEKLWELAKNESPDEYQNGQFVFVKDNEKLTIKKDKVEVLGETMTQITFDFEQSKSKNPYAVKLPEDGFSVTLTCGVTNDEKLLITTNKNIEETYAESLLEDTSFSEVFDAEEREVSNLGYANIENTKNYLTRILTDLAETNENDIAEIELAKERIEKVLNIFDLVYTRSLQTNDFSSLTMELGINFEEISKLADYIEETSAIAPTSFETYKNSQIEFEDIGNEEWYSDDIYYLTTQGVVTGYEDETFKPGNEITRAEFLTLIMRSLEDEGYYTDVCLDAFFCDAEDYTDVDPFMWYAPYVLRARSVGIVEGYTDGSFKPNAPIARAEAVKMLSNALKSIELVAETSTENVKFKDVDKNDWYYDAVQESAQYNIVEGTDKGDFEPLRPINRAESAKIIRRSSELIKN